MIGVGFLDLPLRSQYSAGHITFRVLPTTMPTITLPENIAPSVDAANADLAKTGIIASRGSDVGRYDHLGGRDTTPPATRAYIYAYKTSPPGAPFAKRTHATPSNYADLPRFPSLF